MATPALAASSTSTEPGGLRGILRQVLVDHTLSQYERLDGGPICKCGDELPTNDHLTHVASELAEAVAAHVAAAHESEAAREPR